MSEIPALSNLLGRNFTQKLLPKDTQFRRRRGCSGDTHSWASECFFPMEVIVLKLSSNSTSTNLCCNGVRHTRWSLGNAALNRVLIYGEANMRIQIGRTIFHHQVLIADTDEDGIFGIEILQKYDFEMYLKQHRIQLGC